MAAVRETTTDPETAAALAQADALRDGRDVQSEREQRKPKVVNGEPIHLTGSGRQFKSDFLERFGHVHPLTPLWVFSPVVVALLYFSIARGELGALATVGWVAAGVFVWTISEYWLHRKLFHLPFQRIYYFLHGIHHYYPNDMTRLVMPPGASVLMAIGFWFLADWICGTTIALPFFAGFVAGYIWYDMTHYWTHIAKPKTRWGKMIRRNHMLHHFKDPTKKFGVTTPVWDIVFRTY